MRLRNFKKKAISFELAATLIFTSNVSTFAAGSYDSSDLKPDSLAVAEQIQAEGSVLLKNESNTLPLAEGSKVNIFGSASVVPVIDGGGSGAINIPANFAKATYSDRAGGQWASTYYVLDYLFQELDKRGIESNTELASWYEAWFRINYAEAAYRSTEKEADAGNTFGAAVAMRPDAPFEQLLNPDLAWRVPTLNTTTGTYTYGAYKNNYPTDPELNVNQWEKALRFTNETAIIIIGRSGSESADMAKDELQLRKSEKDLIRHAREDYNKVIVIFNTCNVMEMSELEEYNVDAALMVWAPGEAGFSSIAGILAGEINPSGKLNSTITYHIDDHPSIKNFGNFRYTNGNSSVAANTFLQYEEGIYVGYRYFETFEKTDLVQYPFGYGLSYSTFDQQIVGDIQDYGDYLTLDVEVTNTGNVPGKDVVELYMTAQYNQRSGIEKAKNVLVGFAKTDELAANGGTETVTITVDKYSMASYDMHTNGGCYVIEQGTYAFNVMTSLRSKSIINPVVGTRTYSLAQDIEYTEDPVTGYPIQNQFEDSVKGGPNGEAITVLSRANPNATYPTSPTTADMVQSSYIQSLINAYPDPVTEGEAFNFGVTLDKPIMLQDIYKDAALQVNLGTYDNMGDALWESELWDDFIHQLPQSDALNLVCRGSYSTYGVAAYGINATVDNDGPQQVKGRGTGNRGSGVAYPIASCLACTWNADLAEEMGVRVGLDAAYIGVQSWYAPGTNTHRNPMGGRNFEYYSEDPFLAGEICANVVAGARSEGLTVTVKHFALNDCEQNRGGVLTFADEQTIREIYLKPFEKAVKQGGAQGIMSSFNRIGVTWAGAHVGLLTELLRNEWGFRGYVVTDYLSSTSYMIVALAVYAQNDTMLGNASTATLTTRLNSDPIGMSNAIARSIKNLCYFKMSALNFNMPVKANQMLKNLLQNEYDKLITAKSTSEYGNIPADAQEAFDNYLDAMYLVLMNDYATDAELANAILMCGHAGDLLGLQLIDAEILNFFIEDYSKLDLSLYRSEGKEEFLAALEKAETMYNNGILEEELSDILSELVAARNALRMRANTEALVDALKIADELDLTKYTQKSVESSNIVALMAQARVLLADSEVEDEDIIQHASLINLALSELVEITKTSNGSSQGGKTPSSNGTQSGSSQVTGSQDNIIQVNESTTNDTQADENDSNGIEAIVNESDAVTSIDTTPNNSTAAIIANVPKTGDSSNAAVLLLFAAAATVIAYTQRKKVRSAK